MLARFENRSLRFWLWGGLVVSSLHLVEEVVCFEHTPQHYIWFGFGDPSRHLAFAVATLKQTLFHLAMIAFALWRGGLWLRYITQLFAVILLLVSGIGFVGELLHAGGYVSGAATGTLLVTPFFLLCLRDLLRQGEMTLRGVAAWAVATPAVALAIIYGILT